MAKALAPELKAARTDRQFKQQLAKLVGGSAKATLSTRDYVESADVWWASLSWRHKIFVQATLCDRLPDV